MPNLPDLLRSLNFARTYTRHASMFFHTFHGMIESPLSLRHVRRSSRTRTALSALLLLTLTLCVCLPAAPLTFPTLTTTRGVTYHDVKVSRFDALEVRFSHANGAATVPLSDLPEDLQKIFGYDPLKASAIMADKQQERVKAIITDADKKAKAIAQLEQEKADAAEMKNIRASVLRCYVNRVNSSDEALLAEVSPVDNLPVKVTSKSGNHERVKLDPRGKPELMEQVVPGQTFALGDTIRILPHSALLTPHVFMSVYPVGNDAGPHTLCALSPEDAFRYRKKLAALKAAEAAEPVK